MFGSQEGTPALASGQKQIAAQVEGVKEKKVETLPIMMAEVKSEVKPVISSFMLTKTFSLGLLVLLLVLFALDSILIYQKRIVRVSGKSFIHLSFFIIILISILLYYQGEVL